MADPEFDLYINGRLITIELDELLISAYGTAQCFRALGFSADDIYFTAGLHQSNMPVEMLFYGVSLHTQNKDFTVSLFPQDCIRTAGANCGVKQVLLAYSKFVTRVQQDGYAEQHRELVQKILGVCQRTLKLTIARLRERGFRLPAYESASDTPLRIPAMPIRKPAGIN